MKGIVRRSTGFPRILTCDGCGHDTPTVGLEVFDCPGCGDRLPWAGDVGQIVSVFDTEGGDRIAVRAERHSEGGWYPSNVFHIDGDRSAWRQAHPIPYWP